MSCGSSENSVPTAPTMPTPEPAAAGGAAAAAGGRRAGEAPLMKSRRVSCSRAC